MLGNAAQGFDRGAAGEADPKTVLGIGRHHRGGHFLDHLAQAEGLADRLAEGAHGFDERAKLVFARAGGGDSVDHDGKRALEARHEADGNEERR